MMHTSRIKTMLVAGAVLLSVMAGCNTDLKETIVGHLFDGLQVLAGDLIEGLRGEALPDNSSVSTDVSEQ